MILHRRAVLAGLALTAPGPGARAQPAFPSRDLAFIIPYASGGGFDAYVRAVIPALQKNLGGSGTVLPDNVDGAGGAKAINQLARARPDGYTIAMVNVPGAMILQVQGGLGVDLGTLTWLCNMGRDSYGLMVPASSPIASLNDLQEVARARKIKFTCVGPAGTAYSATRIGAALLGIRPDVIAGYKGTNDYIVAALRGDGEAAIASLTSLAQFVASGLIRVLVTFEDRSSIPGAADATSLGKPELTQIVQLRPVAGPPGLPPAIAATLSGALVAAMRDPKVVAWAEKNSANLQPDGPEETDRLLAQQARLINRWKDTLTAS